jgi:DNA-binding GntR family transcriptional regulator
VARAGAAPTRTRLLQDQLRAELLAGGLHSGQRLPATALAERFSVSTIVVREALTSLAAEGLVVAEPQVGFRVVELSIERLLDLTSVRTDIDGMAMRKAIRDGDVRWEAAALAAHHTLAATPMRDHAESGLSAEWSQAHREFHRRLVEGCGSPVLLDIRDRLWDATQMYRAISVFGDPGRDRDAATEHRELLDAALDRDADRAVGLLASHIRLTAELVLGQHGAPLARER